MLYDLKPSREVTGGPWYTELEFDHEFINELRSFILLCVERSNGGKGVTLGDIASKMERANVSRVQLGAEDVQQIVQALAFDYMIETAGTDAKGEALFVRARGITTLCRFGCKFYSGLKKTKRSTSLTYLTSLHYFRYLSSLFTISYSPIFTVACLPHGLNVIKHECIPSNVTKFDTD